jgi:hypothetical protein
MKATTKANLVAIFGTAQPGQSRDCRIVGVNSRPVAGQLSVPNNQATDLWVWTNQPRRATQDCIARINLSNADAMDQLHAVGVVL